MGEKLRVPERVRAAQRREQLRAAAVARFEERNLRGHVLDRLRVRRRQPERRVQRRRVAPTGLDVLQNLRPARDFDRGGRGVLNRVRHGHDAQDGARGGVVRRIFSLRLARHRVVAPLHAPIVALRRG
eukprot:30145-Pelagococcus_subviridis.AAC.2